LFETVNALVLRVKSALVVETGIESLPKIPSLATRVAVRAAPVGAVPTAAVAPVMYPLNGIRNTAVLEVVSAPVTVALRIAGVLIDIYVSLELLALMPLS
jgi:hypothetical protein